MRKTGSQTVGNAVIWITQHREEWLEIQRVCLILENAIDRQGRHKYHSITRGGIYMLAQMDGIRIANDITFQRDHDLWSVLSRYLTELHPQLKRVIKHRDCDVAKYVHSHGLPELEDKYIYRSKAA